jgi:hypothetical protein
MGAQVLGPRWVRRMREITGQNVVRAWAHGGYCHDFVTTDHRHGWLDLKAYRGVTDGPVWGWTIEVPFHYSSCADL